MKKIFFLVSVLMLFTLMAGAQGKDKFKQRFDDVMEETEHGNLTLRFFNAITGDPIPNATVTVEGNEAQQTDAEGRIIFPVPAQDGFLEVVFDAEGYIHSDFRVEVIAGTIFFNRYSISPILDINKLRVVLDWDQTPPDLDSHFVKDNVYHISYRNTQVLADGSGQLDRDDMDGFGPETITIDKADQNALYGYFVHDFTNRTDPNSKGLSGSKACVKVYGDGRLLQVFEIPQGATGNLWDVFRIENGNVIPVNQVKVAN